MLKKQPADRLKLLRESSNPQAQFLWAILRDSFHCQYCSKTFATSDLTFDHVVPVSRGGASSWDNIVTCCVTCNRKKGSRTPDEAGLTLMRKPARPAFTPVFRVTIGIRRTPESWRDYLYWNAELEND